MEQLSSAQEEFLEGNYSRAISQYQEAYKSLAAVNDEERNGELLARILSNCAAAQLRLEMARKAVDNCNKALACDDFCARAYLVKGNALRKQGKMKHAHAVLMSGLEKCKTKLGDIELLDEMRRLASECDGTTNSNSKTVVDAVKHSVKQKANKDESKQKETLRETKLVVIEAGVDQPTLKKVNADLAHGRLLLNQGQFERAVEKFSHIIADKPHMAEAYVGRGSAYAKQQLFLEAQHDFTTAIRKDSTNSEAWRKRGQVRGALGDHNAAIEDLKESVKRSKNRDCDAEIDLALVYNRMMDYKTSLTHLRNAEQLLQEQGNVSLQFRRNLYNSIGRCHTALGNPIAAIGAHASAIDLDSQFADSYVDMGIAYRDYANFEKAEECFFKALQLVPNHVVAHYMRGCLHYNSGWAQKAIEIFTDGLKYDTTHEDCMFMRGISYQSVGQYRKAWDDFNAVVTRKPTHLAFYYRDLTLLAHHDLDKCLSCRNPDAKYSRVLKEAWTKRKDPQKLSREYEHPPLFNDTIPDVTIPEVLPEEVDLVSKVANQLGSKLQYNTPGFLKNHREHCQSGFAIICVAQKCREVFQRLKCNGETGFTVSGESSSYTNKPHNFDWRDLADIVVQWSQMSEPNDAIWWIDQLDDSNFTKECIVDAQIVHGQCNAIRNYPYQEMAFKRLKQVLDVQFQHNPQQRTRIQKTTSYEDLYNVLGSDFFGTTTVYSHAFAERFMEGTRICVQKELPHGFNFSISIASSRFRWQQYSAELSRAFASISRASVREEKDTQTLLELVLTFAFYWDNMMPLTKAAPSCGLVMIHGLLLAFGLEITNPIPKGMQVNWEAILQPSRDDFISYIISQWIRTSVKPVVPDVVETLPSVEKLFPSLRSVVEVLNFQQ